MAAYGLEARKQHRHQCLEGIPMRDNPLGDLYSRTIRPHLPRRFGLFNGVSVRHPRLLDPLFGMPDHRPEYEAAYLGAIRSHVEPGDTVCLVGGGYGVSTVVAARHGERAITFEAGRDHVQHTREAAHLNNVDDRVTVRHAVVDEAVDAFSSTDKADRVSPADLPDCDVLALDCEGAEAGILENLTIEPRCCIVESHGCYGVPEYAVRDRLEAQDYTVVQRGVEDARLGVAVLTGVRETARTGSETTLESEVIQ